MDPDDERFLRAEELRRREAYEHADGRFAAAVWELVRSYGHAEIATVLGMSEGDLKKLIGD
jgi:hypothetical protein